MLRPRRFIRVLLAAQIAAVLLLPAAAANAAGIRAQAILTGLDFPAAMTVARDGRIFYGERLTGKIFSTGTGIYRLADA